MTASPFETVRQAADSLANPLARSTLLAELAKAQVDAGAFDDALTTVDVIPNRMEKRKILLHLALDAVRDGRRTDLFRLARRMLETDSQAGPVVGRLALDVLESGEVDAAMELLRIAETPFDSDRARYDFLGKLLPLTGLEKLDDVQKFLDQFSAPDYRDWALLAFARRLAALGEWAEAEEWADSFSQPRRRSWALYELSRMAEGERRKKLFERSAKILWTIPIESDGDSEDTEKQAIQLRILGKSALRDGFTDTGYSLLERAEAAAQAISVPIQRSRALLFLAKVLRESGLIDSVGTYLDASNWNRPNLPGIQCSRLLQWKAETERNKLDDWNASVREAARPEKLETDEFPRVERLAELVRRFSFQHQKTEPTGRPDRDAMLLSAEEFEEYYFSPFAVDDCNCS